MNNKRKQQLPSTVPVKFLVLVLRDLWPFSPSFPSTAYEMWLDIQSLAAAHLPALQTEMVQLYMGLSQMIGGWRWHKTGLPVTQVQVRSYTSVWLQKASACQNSSLFGPQALWERDTQGEDGSPSAWVSGGAWRDRQSLRNASPRERQLHSSLYLDSAAKLRAFLCSGCPSSKFLLGLSSVFIAVPFPFS